MCGIIGAFGAIESDKNFLTILQKSLNLLSHRGPDAQAIWQSQNQTCALGHSRLAIIDLSPSGNQPMTDGDNCIVYNGEIYNHHELRNTYLPNAKFNGASDTETLFILMKDYQNRYISELEGMFALAFYNQAKNELTLIRDSLSIKPLYYVTLKEVIYFASEVKALMSLAKFQSININNKILHSYLDYENWDSGESLINEIQVLKAGSILRVTYPDNRLHFDEQIFKYGGLTKSEYHPGINLEDYVINSINKSVVQHLLSDVEIAAYVSGGIDSGLVASLASRINHNILGFTGYYKTNDWYDERPVASIVAKKAGIDLVEVEITPDDFINHFDELILTLEEPRMGMGTFSQYIVAKEVAKYRKVVLSGNGGDELFAGYPMIRAAYFLDNMKTFANLMNFSINDWIFLVYQLINKVTRTGFKFAPQITTSVLLVCKPDKTMHSVFQAQNNANYTKQLIEYYKSTYIPGLMAVEDKISMHFSLETRFPLWSQQLTEDILQISTEKLLSNGQLKGLLKSAIAKHDLLPIEALNAPKRGFPTPLKFWFKNHLYDYLQDKLLNNETPLFQILFKKNAISKLLYSHKHHPLPGPLEEKRAHQLWMLLSMESWLRQFNIQSN